jgi:hypothetical protein
MLDRDNSRQVGSEPGRVAKPPRCLVADLKRQ